MAIETRTQLKTYFQTGDTPTQAQFINLIDSAVPFQKTITDADSPYTVLDTDKTLFADATGADVIILLPSAASSSGRELKVKKIDGSGNRVKLTPDGSDEIEISAAVYDIVNPFEAFLLQSNGIITWWFTAKYIP